MFKRIRHHRYFPHIFWLTVILIVLILVFLFSKKTYSDYLIFDTHEHIQSMQKALSLRYAMADIGIGKTVLVASPTETLTLNGHKSFTGYKDNMDVILKIAKKYPKDFIPFCTISPLDKDALESLKDCVARGGKGLKLYNGHSLYYPVFNIPLDSPVMDPIYAYAEDYHLPILYHVNMYQYEKEFENVLKKFPSLIVSIPHYMVSGKDLQEAKYILDTYPNTYTDISFGSDPFLAEGFSRISDDIPLYKDFFTKYSDRILFGADMVLNNNPKKDQKFMETYLKCYKDILEKETFSCQPITDFYKSEMEKAKEILNKCPAKKGNFCQSKKAQVEKFTQLFNKSKKLNGLGLSDDILEKIYIDNPERFLSENNL